MSVSEEVVIANGVEFHVWRELSTFITWGHMMSEDAIRFTASNMISYRDKCFNLNYENRIISIDSVEQGDVPSSLINILKDVTSSAVKHNNMIGKRLN